MDRAAGDYNIHNIYLRIKSLWLWYLGSILLVDFRVRLLGTCTLHHTHNVQVCDYSP
jgi:hypothetical protein